MRSLLGFVAALTVLYAASAPAGEVIGNTYISEKDGVIEIKAEGWEIKDTEGGGVGFQIAVLTLKLQGMTPSLQVYRLPNPGGAITQEHMLGELRKALEKQGMEVGAIEPRRIAGKRVLSLSVSMVRGGRANGLIYMLQGEKSLYWTQFFANAAVWDEARTRYDALMENVKY